MKINLVKVFDEQRFLDKHIHQIHNVSYQTIGYELKLALIVELAELANEIRSFKFWSLKPSSAKDVILEEYVDGIHFITSLCIKFKVEPKFNITGSIKRYKSKKEITKSFIELFQKASDIDNDTKARTWYASYLKFGLKLGLTMNDIIKAYELKNQVNHQRQENKY